MTRSSTHHDKTHALHAHGPRANAHPIVLEAPHGLRERLGEAIGGAIAPVVALVARARKARVFHADGLTFAGTLAPVVGSPFEAMARELGRTVMVRMSPALWRGGREWPDVLGIALRCHRGHLKGARATGSDQDLLFATIRSPLTLALAPFTTRQHDYLANRYRAVSPFAIAEGASGGGVERIALRLSPARRDERAAPTSSVPTSGAKAPARTGSRDDKIREAVKTGEVRFVLEARRTLTLAWHAIATIEIEREIDIDQAALQFDPFHDGGGIVPVGVVHAIRRAVYEASQAARH